MSRRQRKKVTEKSRRKQQKSGRESSGKSSRKKAEETLQKAAEKAEEKLQKAAEKATEKLQKAAEKATEKQNADKKCKKRKEVKNMEQKAKKSMILWTLFRSMFLLSACTFGGGFVIVSLMKKKFVEELKWLEEEEMLDITAITQSSPGPLPVNASVIIGYRMCGVTGSLAAVLGAVLPPMIIISVISYFYNEFRTNPYIAIALQVMRAGVAAVIVDVVINLTKNVWKTKRVLYIGMMLAAFTVRFFLGVSAMLIILLCLGIGIADVLYDVWKRKKAQSV